MALESSQMLFETSTSQLCSKGEVSLDTLPPRNRKRIITALGYFFDQKMEEFYTTIGELVSWNSNVKQLSGAISTSGSGSMGLSTLLNIRLSRRSRRLVDNTLRLQSNVVFFCLCTALTFFRG